MRQRSVLLALAAMLIASAAVGGSGIDTASCSFRGKKLYGKIQIVRNFADVKVQVVTSFPDLKVKTVAHFADTCGEWQMVEHFPDTKVRFVEHFPDVRIEYVESFPGIP